jgi:hypothetical protein
MFCPVIRTVKCSTFLSLLNSLDSRCCRTCLCHLGCIFYQAPPTKEALDGAQVLMQIHRDGALLWRSKAKSLSDTDSEATVCDDTPYMSSTQRRRHGGRHSPGSPTEVAAVRRMKLKRSPHSRKSIGSRAGERPSDVMSLDQEYDLPPARPSSPDTGPKAQGHKTERPVLGKSLIMAPSADVHKLLDVFAAP